MNPGALFHDRRHRGWRDDRETIAALVIAILFAVLAAASFAIDQNVTLSSLPEPPAVSTTR